MGDELFYALTPHFLAKTRRCNLVVILLLFPQQIFRCAAFRSSWVHNANSLAAFASYSLGKKTVLLGELLPQNCCYSAETDASPITRILTSLALLSAVIYPIYLDNFHFLLTHLQKPHSATLSHEQLLSRILGEKQYHTKVSVLINVLFVCFSCNGRFQFKFYSHTCQN